MTSTTVDRRYLPGRGLLYSLLVHAIVFFGLFVLSVAANFTEPPRPKLRVTMINLRDPNYRMYLPILGGADPDIALPKRTSETSHAPAAEAAASAKGLSYPGPQPVLSDFPKPTNRALTVLQPKLKNPPTLKPPLLLPNIIQMAVAAPVPPPPPALKTPEPLPPAEPLEPKTNETAKPTPLPLIEMPKVVLPPPLARAQNLPIPETKPQEPQPPVPPPNAPEPPAKPVEPVLVLSPMPAPPQDSPKVPLGEARGRFAISPEPNLAGSEMEAGSKIGTVSATAASRTPPAPRNTAAGGAAPLAGGTAGGTGSDKHQDSADGYAGAGNPNGSGNGSAPGSKPGSGSGAGSSAGKGKDAFPGITILGGSVDGGSIVNTRPSTNTITIGGNPPPLQTSYGLTILSTETSGGGLPQFGVFSNEQIYTVYLDMRRTIADPAPSWTFEYAVPKGAAAQLYSPKSATRNQQGVVLPFPVIKEQPAFPVDVARKYLRQRIIMFAVINVDGKVEQMTVKDSPDTHLNEPVLTALSKWTFRPAQLDGESVAVKVLMGIPISLFQ